MPTSLPVVPDTGRRDWTVKELRALPESSSRFEIIDGELFVTPAPSWLHQQAVLELAVLLRPYAQGCALFCLIAPAEVAFSTRRSVEPDIFVVPRVGGRPARHFDEVRRLALVVEVLSPSTARADRRRKRALYQSEAVPEYWIVDLDARLIERWRPGDERPEIFHEVIEWAPVDDVAPLRIDLQHYFQQVHGDE